jgi:hypothetical protein
MVISLERLGGLELVGKLTKVMGWRGGLKVMEVERMVISDQLGAAGWVGAGGVERRLVMAWSKSAGGG